MDLSNSLTVEVRVHSFFFRAEHTFFYEKKGGVIMKTLKNKIVAIALIIIGVLSAYISKDSTFLVFSLMIGAFLFISKENCIN